MNGILSGKKKGAFMVNVSKLTNAFVNKYTCNDLLTLEQSLSLSA
jgi:hypothetical protein